MEDLIKELTDKNDRAAYAKAQWIIKESETSSAYYSYFNEFAKLLDNKSSFVRARAFILCSSQARWDKEQKIHKILPQMLQLFHDEKPTVVRQCLKAVKELIIYCPECIEEIKKEIGKIDITKYNDSMSPLIKKDITLLAQL